MILFFIILLLLLLLLLLPLSSLSSSVVKLNSILELFVNSFTTLLAPSLSSINKQTNNRNIASLNNGFLAIFCNNRYKYCDLIGSLSSFINLAKIGNNSDGANVRHVSSAGSNIKPSAGERVAVI